MTANVSIITNKSEDVLCVPNMALKFTPDINGPKYKNQGIWILDNNKPKRVDITTGANDDTSTEIITDAITEGNKVIVSILSKHSKNDGKNSGRAPMPRL